MSSLRHLFLSLVNFLFVMDLQKYLGGAFSGSAIVSALLGTSCCAIQLFLNAFSFGCAGTEKRVESLTFKVLLYWTLTTGSSKR